MGKKKFHFREFSAEEFIGLSMMLVLLGMVIALIVSRFRNPNISELYILLYNWPILLGGILIIAVLLIIHQKVRQLRKDKKKK